MSRSPKIDLNLAWPRRWRLHERTSPRRRLRDHQRVYAPREAVSRPCRPRRSYIPTSKPTNAPFPAPSPQPSYVPTSKPTDAPVPAPSPQPSCASVSKNARETLKIATATRETSIPTGMCPRRSRRTPRRPCRLLINRRLHPSTCAMVCRRRRRAARRTCRRPSPRRTRRSCPSRFPRQPSVSTI